MVYSSDTKATVISTSPSSSRSVSPPSSSSSSPNSPPPPPMVVVSPCAACKILRRRCAEKCVLAPYFPPNDPIKFTTAHRVFGASNIIKFLQVHLYSSYVPSFFSPFLSSLFIKNKLPSILIISPSRDVLLVNLFRVFSVYFLIV